MLDNQNFLYTCVFHLMQRMDVVTVLGIFHSFMAVCLIKQKSKSKNSKTNEKEMERKQWRSKKMQVL